MASDGSGGSNYAATHHHNKSLSPSSRTHHQQQQLVSTMIKQGFLSDPFLSPSRLPSLSPPPSHRHLPSPTSTLFDVMSVDHPKPAPDARRKLQERVSAALSQAPFKMSDLWGTGDVRLTVAARAEAGEVESAAFRVTVDVHRRVLAAKSRFFAEKLRRSGTRPTRWIFSSATT